MGMPSMKYGTRQESSSNERLIDFKPHDTTNELIILKEEINELKSKISFLQQENSKLNHSNMALQEKHISCNVSKNISTHASGETKSGID